MSEGPGVHRWLTSAQLDLLRTDPWFGSLSADFASHLLALAEPRCLQAGETLFLRGDPPCGLYAVLDGALRVSGGTEAGKEAILSLLDPPGWFGEVAVFDGLPRTHDVVAESASLILHVPTAALQSLMQHMPQAWRELGVLMSLRLRLSFINMEDQALAPAEIRLARRLLWLSQSVMAKVAEGAPCVLPVSQTQLGLMLSLSRQTTNQMLQSLQAQGILRVSYGRIELLDRAQLIVLGRLSPVEKRILARLQPAPSA